MKDKILQALKTKFKNLGFGDKAFDGVATFLAITVTEETAIETAISGVEPLLKSFQSDADARVTSAVAKAKAEKEPGAEPKEPKEPKKEGEDIAAIVAAAVKTAIEPIQQELSGFKGQKTFETRKQTLEAKLEKAPAKFKEKILKDFARMRFEKDDEFDAYLTETETDLTAFTQEIADQGLGANKKPFVASFTKEGISTGVQAFVDSKDPKKAGTDNLGGKEV
jgi:hypothetical protein